MAIKYDLSAIEILRLLGYTELAGITRLEVFEKENNIKLPSLLSEFLRLAEDNSLFSTADIWTTDCPSFFFFYDEIEEMIEEEKEYWEKNPEKCDEDEYFHFFQMPKEQWSNHVSNYLEIGSDYSAGVVNFGIRAEDLAQENPPVYVLHEADSLTDWKILDHTLSDYLMRVLCDVLVCIEYNTAKKVLQKAGWSFYEYDNLEETQKQLSQRKINLSALNKYSSLYGTEDEFYRCCYDEEEKILFIIKNDISLTMLKAK